MPPKTPIRFKVIKKNRVSGSRRSRVSGSRRSRDSGSRRSRDSGKRRNRDSGSRRSRDSGSRRSRDSGSRRSRDSGSRRSRDSGSRRSSRSSAFIQKRLELDDTLFGDMLSIWIVLHGGRPACLIESAAYDRFEKNWEILRDFANQPRLYITLDPNSKSRVPRYIISKEPVPNKLTQQQLGKLLGYSYLKVDYDVGSVSRFIPQIYALVSNPPRKILIWSEYSRDSDISFENALYLFKKWKVLLNEHPFPFETQVELELEVDFDDGWNNRLDKLYDDEYFTKNYSKYLGDVERFSDSEEYISVMKEPIRNVDDLVSRRELWFQVMTPVIRKSKTSIPSPDIPTSSGCVLM